MVFAPAVAANAATSVGGWTALDTITAGATNTINAVKGSGATAMRSAVTVGASAAKVGKHLIKGGGYLAVALAVSQLVGDSVDWVLDPANNAIKYTITDGGGSGVASYRATDNSLHSTADSAAAASCFHLHKVGFLKWYSSPASPSKTVSSVVCVGNKEGGNVYYVAPTTTPPTTVEKYIPINTVAAKVIANAESGHAPSQEAVKATALEGFAAGEYDAALDAAAEAAPDTDTPTDPENPPAPDTPLPFDPSSIIAAINALKALLAGILSSITGLSDFFQDTPPDKSQSETDVPVEVPPDVKNASEFDVDYVSFGGQCPTMSPFSINILGSSSSMTFDMTPLCNLAVTIRPAIIAIAYFIGLGVIASAIRET